MPSLSAALVDLGFEATSEGPNLTLVVVPFDYGEVGAELAAVVEVAADSVVLDLVVPVLNVHTARLEEELPDDPTAAVRGLIDLEESEVHIVAAAAGSVPDATLVVESLIPQTCRALHELLDAGIIDVSDASDDDRVTELMESLPAMRQANPRGAVSLAVEGAGRCRSLGDSTLASFLEIAAGEVLIELGDINAAADLVEPAWLRMDMPTHWREVVTVVAQLRARQGDVSEAVDLMQDALEQQDDAFDAAVVRGDLGVLLAQHGRRVEASRLLDAATRDDSLDDLHREHFRRQLGLLRSVGGDLDKAATIDEEDDALGAANARTNELASILLEGDRRTLATKRTRIEDLIARVAADLDFLGPAQAARLALARGCVSVLDGQPDSARSHFEEALSLADASGDVELARWVRNQAESLLEPTGTVATASSSTSAERLAALLNQALAELSTDMRRAHGTASAAIDLVDSERHRYVTVADRVAWARLAARVYEIGLLTSVATADEADVVEILERARAQGAPAHKDEDRAPSDGSTADRSTPSTRLLALIQESLGDRPVSRPLVASLRSHESADDDAVARVPLDDVVSGIAGGPAWWWACHGYGERLYWVVRSAEGKTWTGANMLPGGLEGMVDIARAFRSVASEEDLRLHPLIGDEPGGRAALFDWLAKAILPRPLVDAVVAAAGRDEPIRVVWAAPQELARVPVGILPVGRGRIFLDGAVVVVAPPTSLALAGDVRPDSPPPRHRPVLLVLGGDSDLGMLRDLASAISSVPDQVLGAARHVKAGIAGSLATPAAVVRALRDNPRAVAVYYGHVDEDGASSQSAALSLTDGVRRATLEASRLLVPEREGAPDLVVLAGCSSLSATDSGTGEWWGLATALLWQGSHHVVGSMWDVLPTPATQVFVAELAASLRVSDDPPLVLRDLQRRYHESWLRTEQPSPYEWAGWSILSSSSASAVH